MESLHGLTKGTELEPMIKAIAQAEANGVMMYYALARLATEQGLDEVAAKFIEAAPDAKIYVCPVCGYEHEGDLDSEPDDWTCPLCGQPKSAFKPKV